MSEEINEVRNATMWARKLTDGRLLVLAVVNDFLPEGVNDALVRGFISAAEYQDATAEGQGKSYPSILADGWKWKEDP